MRAAPVIGRRRVVSWSLVWELLAPHSEAAWLIRVVAPTVPESSATVRLPWAWGLPVRLYDADGPLVAVGDWLEWDAGARRWAVIEQRDVVVPPVEVEA